MHTLLLQQGGAASMAILFQQKFCVVGVYVCISGDPGILGETDSNLRYQRWTFRKGSR